MNEEKDIYAIAKDPAASVNDMLRKMAFTARQTGKSFLVRHEAQDKGVWLYHLGGEEEVVCITQRVSLPMSVWLDANVWNVAWPTTGEQLEYLQDEADEHIKALGREELACEELARAKAKEFGFPHDFLRLRSRT